MALGNSRYGPDRIMWAITIDSSNKALVVTEDSGARTDTIALTEQTAWNHADAGLSNHPALLDDLITKLNASSTLSGTYSVAASTPANSSLTNSGITISASGITDFTFEFANASSTIDPRLLGFGESPGDQSARDASMESPYSIYGVWQSPHAAHDKRDARKQSVVSSTPDPVNAYRNAWQGHRRRLMHYRFVPAGHVRRWAAEDSTIASDAGLPTGDINNALADFLWDASVSNEDIVVVYDDGDQDLQVDSHTSKYEYVRFADDREIESLLQMIEDVPRGEEYDLRWHFASDVDDPEYKDP